MMKYNQFVTVSVDSQQPFLKMMIKIQITVRYITDPLNTKVCLHV